MSVYRVKTTSGYYHSVGGGRYGRAEGTRLEAWLLCEEHADAVVSFFNEHVPEYKASKEKLNGHAPCNRCLVQGFGDCR